MSGHSDVRVGDIISAWKVTGSFNESDLRYGRVIKISEDEIITHPSLSDCSISPRSGNSRFRVCARRVPCGPFVVNKLPLLFPIDLNDGQCDVHVNRHMGIVTTMLLVHGHDTRWVTLAEAARDARGTEHASHVDGAAFKEADDDGNFADDLFAKINNCTELAVKTAVEELGGTYSECLVPDDTPNDDVSRLVSDRRATWRTQITTALKAVPALDDDESHGSDDSGAVAKDGNNDNGGDNTVLLNDDTGDEAVAQLRQEQASRHAKENNEREQRHAKELAATVGEAAARKFGISYTAEQYAQLPHNNDIVRKGNYEEMTVIPLDYERITSQTPSGETLVVVGADVPLFKARQFAHCSLPMALRSEGAELGTLYRTATGIRVEYGPPSDENGLLVSETFEIVADGQPEPDEGSWNLLESLHFGVVMIPTPTTAPTTAAGATSTTTGGGTSATPTTAAAAAETRQRHHHPPPGAHHSPALVSLPKLPYYRSSVMVPRRGMFSTGPFSADSNTATFGMVIIFG